LEVIYDDSGITELTPPGQRAGDLIFSETTYQDNKAVVVLRNVGLMTLSNVLSASTASTTMSSSTITSASTTPEITVTTSATSTIKNQTLTNIVSTSTLSEIINSTGILVELWLYSSTTDSWTRIADDSILSRNPQVKFINGNIFWIDRNNLSVWRHNPSSGGYDALSFSEGQVSKMQFTDESGELKELEFISGTSSIQLREVDVQKSTTITW
jgi:hypothetical protein